MGSDPVIFIRTDSNEEIAAGHIVRCFAIAEALLPAHRVCFLVSCSQSVHLLERLFTPEISCDIRMLRTGNLKEPEQELAELTGILQEAGDCVLLVDSYFVTKHYLEVLRLRTRLAYLDDLQMFPYPVDLVINYDILSDSDAARYRDFCRTAGKVLLGGEYAPLRRQFHCPQFYCSQFHCPQFHRGLPLFRPRAEHILLTTGGSDPFAFSETLLHTLPAHLPRAIHCHVVAGRYFTNKETLRHLCERSEQFHYYEDVQDMAALMASCDLAVCAAGTTLYELCALGIPSICFTMADNQLAAAAAFAAKGAVVCAGDLRDADSGDPKHPALKNILSFLQEMCDNPKLRQEAGQRMHRLVDGQGAVRIARELILLADPTSP